MAAVVVAVEEVVVDVEEEAAAAAVVVAVVEAVAVKAGVKSETTTRWQASGDAGVFYFIFLHFPYQYHVYSLLLRSILPF